jgi:hypothetical protein
MLERPLLLLLLQAAHPTAPMVLRILDTSCTTEAL